MAPWPRLKVPRQEAEERLVKLKEILKLLLSSEEGEGEEGRRAEIAAISSKIKEVGRSCWGDGVLILLMVRMSPCSLVLARTSVLLDNLP